MKSLILLSCTLLITLSLGESNEGGIFKRADHCGQQMVRTRIIGGEETVPGEFPWVAGLEYENTNTNENQGIKCGASVASEKYVITAAHCIDPTNLRIIKVWVGVWKISVPDNVQKLDIEEKIPHESFNTPSGANDIGLIRVQGSIMFNDFVRPICMPRENLAPPPLGTIMTVAGWGTTESGSTSDIKLKVEMQLLGNNECADSLHLPVGDTQLCVGGFAGRDSCKGDSGGPLMINFTDSGSGNVYWYQAGIVSYGRGCRNSLYLGVYTRLSSFIDWIRRHIH